MAHTLHTPSLSSVTLSMVAALTLGLTACGGGDGSSSATNTTAVSTTKTDSTPDDSTSTNQPINPTPTNPTTTPDSSSLSCGDGVTQQAMLNAINQARSNGRYCGSTFYPAVAKLSWNGYLAKAAVTHADNMATQDFFSHTGKDGSTYKTRIYDAGYPQTSSIGENIGAGQKTVNKVMEELLESNSHCENIMRPVFKEIGMACAYSPNSTYKYYWVQSFGAVAGS